MANNWSPFGQNSAGPGPQRTGRPQNSQGGPVRQMPDFPWRRVLKFWPLFLLLIVVSWIGMTSFYTVREYEQAVVTTFGAYTKTVDAGLNWKLPFPVQRAEMLPVNRTQKLELGYYQNPDGSYTSNEDESMMITGDLNVVNIDFFLEWKISDPVAYLFNASEPVAILRNLLQSSVRSVVGTRSIDDVLTTGKIQIQADVQELLAEKIDEAGIGIQIIDVKVNDSEPPTEEIARAFREVENAKQQKDTALNQAIQYQNSQMPQARSQSDRIIQQAEAAKQSRINEAVGERDRFMAIYEEYRNYPDITRTRMYLEAMEDILPGVTLYIDNGTGTQTLLPLAPFSGGQAGAQPSAAPSPSPSPTPIPETEVKPESDNFN